MDHDIDVRPGPASEPGGLATHELPAGVMIATRTEIADARSLTVPPIQGSIEGRRRRLRAVAGDVDQLWRDALDSQDFDLVTRSVDASRRIHRALLARDDDRLVIRSVGERPDEGCRSGRACPASS